MIANFFIWCSGADPNLIEKIPIEKSKYISIGLAVFISTFLAFISGSYAFSSIFNDNYVHFIIGFMWAMIAFGLDRSLTMSFSFSYYTDKLSIFTLIKRVFPIFIFNFLLTIIFTTPLVIQLFEKDVNEKQKQLIYKKSLDLKLEKSKPFNLTIESLQSQKSEQEKEVKQLRNELNDEISRGQISGIKGYGPRANYILNYIKQKELVISSIANDIGNIEKNKIVALSTIKEDAGNYYSGLIGKIESLNQLETESKTVSWIRQLLLFLFFTIQMLPFILKYFSKSNAYEKLFESQGEIQLKSALKQNTIKKNDSNNLESGYYEFESYFLQIINNMNKISSNYDKKASNLLLYGIGIISIGILSYFTFIFYWLDLFKTNGFKIYYLYTIGGSSLSFLFIEMLGGWFLKQYKYCIDKNHFHLKLKTILERQFLAYLYLSEIKSEKDQYKASVSLIVEMLKSEINFPELLENSSSAFMKEAFDTLNSLTDTIKKVADKK